MIQILRHQERTLWFTSYSGFVKSYFWWDRTTSKDFEWISTKIRPVLQCRGNDGLKPTVSISRCKVTKVGVHAEKSLQESSQDSDTKRKTLQHQKSKIQNGFQSFQELFNLSGKDIFRLWEKLTFFAPIWTELKYWDQSRAAQRLICIISATHFLTNFNWPLNKPQLRNKSLQWHAPFFLLLWFKMFLQKCHKANAKTRHP